MTRRGFLGLGSNVGDRLANLRAAAAALPGHGIAVQGRSSAYETEPQGAVPHQPDFLNACLEVATALEPLAALEACKGVERELGRSAAGVRHGPRVIDVDLLLLGDVELDVPELTLPHRDVLDRRFVLVPLLELDPELALPDGTRLAEALARLGGQRVERAALL